MSDSLYCTEHVLGTEDQAISYTTTEKKTLNFHLDFDDAIGNAETKPNLSKENLMPAGLLTENGSWVGFVSRQNNKRNELSLIYIKYQNANPGSLVITDCWNGYEGLTKEGWNYLTVNHSYNFLNFLDPFTRANTQHIENLRWPERKKSALPFGEFLRIKNSSQKPSRSFLVLLKHAADLYPPPK
ncbi:hypothetical protein RF11_14305 [Thelohanellus kitauei]|uniref:ISXO2-like transposase domain-containing protein n=1 Tax=Thelohanellus kitauei TaxID=669202 RepID=A0A0C2MK46_THEKT|nr:hypothetical protein RF11_14305 [Thelohanellus kitauei]